MIRKLILAASAAIAAGAVILGLSALPASATATTVTAVTAITGRDDSGNNGNWALDDMNRTVTATLIGLHSGPECGALSPCYQYTGSVTDAGGTFTSGAGAFTPNQSTPGLKIHGTVSGTFTGGSAGFTFYADSNTPGTARVPVSVTGDGPLGTSEWMTLLFPAGTHFAGSLLPAWSWSYRAPATCEHWVDAYNNNAGDAVADGNITGLNHCPAPALIARYCGSEVWKVTQNASHVTEPFAYFSVVRGRVLLDGHASVASASSVKVHARPRGGDFEVRYASGGKWHVRTFGIPVFLTAC